jgi:hypothetical protein
MAKGPAENGRSCLQNDCRYLLWLWWCLSTVLKETWRHFYGMIPLCGNTYSPLSCIPAKWSAVMPRYVTYTAWITADFTRRQTAHSFMTALRLGADDSDANQPHASSQTTVTSAWYHLHDRQGENEGVSSLDRGVVLRGKKGLLSGPW